MTGHLCCCRVRRRADLRRRARVVIAFAWFALAAYLFHLAWQL